MSKPARLPATETAENPLDEQELARIDSWWRACNYLSVGMIYLQDNPLLREPLRPEHIKQRLLGHWGASPALSFVWAHLNRVIKRDDLDVIFVAGPATARRVFSAPPTSKARTRRSIPTRAKTRRACRSSSSSSRFRATSART